MNYEMFEGYEIPADTSKYTRVILRKLKERGAVRVIKNDRTANIIKKLKNISQDEGLQLLRTARDEIILIDKLTTIEPGD